MKKKSDNPKEDEVITFETFQKPGSYEVGRMKDDNPSCFNGWVRVKKYKVTIEPIEESKDVYFERLNKMWRECDNHHHYQPLMATAARLGIELDRNEFRKDEKIK